MRQQAIETTMKYYVAQEADDLAAELWSQYSNLLSVERPFNM